MLFSNRGRWSARLCLVLAVAVSSSLVGAEPATTQGESAQPKAETVDVFKAINDGMIDVKFIAKNPHQANLVIENKTKKPLTVELPKAFAGMPVLAQQGFDANQQGVGGGAGAGFNVAPEKVRRVKIKTLCLEHGKADPNPRVAYEIRPIEDLTTKPEVVQLVSLYGQGGVDVKAAQAAAWHLENGISWNELSAKEIKHLRGPSDPYFTRSELAGAVQLAKVAVAQAKKLGENESLANESDSLSGAVVD